MRGRVRIGFVNVSNRYLHIPQMFSSLQSSYSSICFYPLGQDEGGGGAREGGDVRKEAIESSGVGFVNALTRYHQIPQMSWSTLSNYYNTVQSIPFLYDKGGGGQ